MTHLHLPSACGDEIRLSPRPVRAEMAPRPLSGPVVLRPRHIPGGVAATLDGLATGALPRLIHEGPVSGLRRALRVAFAERLARPRWLANWLLDDVLDQAALMVELTGASAFRVALDVGSGDPDAPFAAAEARLRLVTSYRGPGIDWLSPRAAAGWSPDAEPPAAALRRLARGDVAILRGRRDGGAGVLHRAAAGPDAAALRLTIDEAGRPRRGVARGADWAGGALQ